MHFRDVAKLLTKVAIENKYGNSESLWDMTEKLKLALKDMWYARYPQLVELKENFHQISVDAFGTRMKGFDTKMYQAAETMRETYKRRKRLVEAKRILTNYALKIIQNDGVDEVNKDRLQAMMREDGILSSKRMFHHILSDFQQKKRLTSSGSKYTKEESLSQDIQSQTAKFPGRPEEPSEPVRHHKSIFSQGAVLTERLVQTAENSRGTTIEFSIPKLKLKLVKPSDALKRSDTIKKKGSNANDTSVRKSKRKKDMSFQNSNSESPYLAETAEEMGQQVEILEEIQDFEQIGLHNFVHKLKTEEGQEGSFSSSNQDSSDHQDSPTPQKQPVIVVQAIDSPPPTRGAPNTPQMPRAITLRKNKSLKGSV